MDFVDRILDYLETNVVLFTKFRVDILDEGDNALTLRRIPSSPSTRFLDNSRDDQVQFQILVKNTSQSVAIDKMNEIMKCLEGADSIQSQNNSFQFITCQVYSLPTFVEKNDRDCYIYSALFRVILTV